MMSLSLLNKLRAMSKPREPIFIDGVFCLVACRWHDMPPPAVPISADAQVRRESAISHLCVVFFLTITFGTLTY